jgi:hypothetical protein
LDFVVPELLNEVLLTKNFLVAMESIMDVLGSLVFRLKLTGDRHSQIAIQISKARECRQTLVSSIMMKVNCIVVG